MAFFDWLNTVDKLTPAALTVRAQAVSPNDNGRLTWDIYAPRQNADSIILTDLTTPDHRPTADRREWDGKGRRIHDKVPTLRKIEMVPIEAFYSLGEREMQLLNQQAGFDAALVRARLIKSIPQRATDLASACYRRLELDFYETWILNQITQRNPEDATKTVTTPLGFDSSRYVTDGTAWNSTNAYNRLILMLQAAEDATGGVEGVMLRLATMLVIEQAAPTYLNGIQMTRTELQDHIQQKTGKSFRFEVNEKTVDVYTDGGLTTSRTKVFPAQRVAAIPDGTAVGSTYFVTVTRAAQLAQEVPQAQIDEQGVTIFPLAKNDGKELEVQGQVNAMPVPDEGKTFVYNVGV